MLTILLYISLISGGILVLMLLLSLLGGLDLDIDFGDADGGAGIVKGTLIFFSVGSYIVRGFLMADKNPLLSLAAGILAGTISVVILIYLFKWIMSKEENVNWSVQDCLYEKGKVYLKIPSEGTGLIHVLINGVNREFKAKTSDKADIPTGTLIMVEKLDGELAVVTTKF